MVGNSVLGAYHAAIHLTYLPEQSRRYSRGLQFYTFFGISIGIKRRLIDIAKKITFSFLQNVWKCTVFSHLHFRYGKSAIMTQKIFFLKYIKMGIKKHRILYWFQIRWPQLSEMPLTKVKSKKPRKNSQNTQNSHSFLALAFFRGICLSRHQWIRNQHKILHFLIPILIFFKKNFFGVIIALFAFFKCKCEKSCTFSNILQK